MPKQWTLIFDEIALGGSVLPLWLAIKAICVELARQGYVQEAGSTLLLLQVGMVRNLTDRPTSMRCQRAIGSFGRGSKLRACLI